MLGAMPQSCQAELCICIQGRFFENALSGMKKLTNEGVVQPRLPFLNECEFKAPVIGSFRVDGDGSPDIQVVVFLPVAKSKLSLYKSFVVELKKFPGTTILPVEGMMHGGSNIKLGLHVHDMSETNVNTPGLEKWLGEEIVMGEISTSFQIDFNF